MTSQTPKNLAKLFDGIKTEIPDWRDESAYPTPGKTSISEWATQFAWRNPRQRKEWTDFMANRHPVYNLLQIGESHEVITMIDDHVVGCDYFEPNRFLAGRLPMQYDHILKSHPDIGKPKHARQFNIQFNLEAPIDAQIEKAKGLLNYFKDAFKEQGLIKPMDTKINERLFPLYLRLLDAEAAGVASEDVISTLYVKQKGDDDKTIKTKYYNHLKSAKDLRDGGYRKLLHTEPHKQI